MKYKISYKDPNHNLHVRYYNALNSHTAKEMFNASVAHSIKEPVDLLSIHRLEENHWVKIKKS
jgi:predicted aldo/keto reductase-like oxidoreductase